MKWPGNQRPRRSLLLALGVVCLLTALRFLFWYGGGTSPSTRSLIRLAAGSANQGISMQAQEAIRIRDTNALPDLLRALQATDSRSEAAYRKLHGSIPGWVTQALPPPVTPQGVRSVATVAVSNLGSRAREAIPLLIELTHAPELFIRLNAVMALGNMGPDAELARPRLVELLQESNRWVRLRAASVLTGFDLPPPEARQTLLLEVTNPINPLSIRLQVAGMIRGSEGVPELVNQMVAQALQSTNGTVAKDAILSVFNMSKETQRELLPALVASLRPVDASDDWMRLAFLCDILIKLGPEAHAAIPGLLKAGAIPPNEFSKIELALQEIGSPTQEELPAVIAALQDENPRVRRLAMQVMDRTRIKTETAFPTLAAVLKRTDTDVDFRRSATLALYNASGRDVAVAAPILLEVMKDPEIRVRAAALNVFGWFGPEAKIALPDLVKALDDPDDWVRWCAASCIAKTGQAALPVLPELLAKLRSARGNYHFAAANALCGLRAEARAAVPDLETMTGDSDPWVRLAAAWALWKIDGQTEVPIRICEAVLKDAQNSELRREAQEDLQAIQTGRQQALQK